MPDQVYVLELGEIDATRIADVGGKGAGLGELSRIDGIRVPPAFCVTTDAFRRIMRDVPSADARLDRLSRLAPDDRDAIGARSAEMRGAIEGVAIPDDIADAITRALTRLGGDDEGAACAVRSSATAEDLPTASFAGQQDSYLDVVGTATVLDHVRRCWGSLFTERAVTYRLRNGIDHRAVHMAVVVQRMVHPYAAGTLFTADPITGNRTVCAIEAVAGLGESLVAGHVNADAWTVRDGAVATHTVRREPPVLEDAQVVELAALGRRIEAHFGRPQDIEWCLDGDGFHVVQSRPITTLFPVPARDDGGNHVYISVGHQQMMTDPMKPLGVSLWQLPAPRTMHEAAGRFFVDVTDALGRPASRANLIAMFRRADPLIGDALQTIADRDGFVPPLPDDGPAWAPPGAAGPPLETDPAIVTELIAQAEASTAALRREIASKSGDALLAFILADLQTARQRLFDPRSMQAINAGLDAARWLNEHMLAWLSETSAADTLAQSVPHNVTSEMGLALLDVADVVRAHPAVTAFLQQVDHDDDFLGALLAVEGGRETRAAIDDWLDKYGMRGVGEIDITRPRWRERPAMLLPLILGNVRNFEAGERARRFERGLVESARKERELLDRLRALPDGEEKAVDTKRMIDRLRTFAGYREYPKYAKIAREFVYKQALVREADRLVEAGVLRDREDVFFLSLHELHDVVRTGHVDHALVRQRMDAFASYRALVPPRVMTSDGEAITGSYRRDDLPAGALVGLPVSAGTVEGRARVALDMATADIEPGDILVTVFTDPSWTPLFVSIAGLVTEVGGLMTHGAVIAREYGLPAIVGVEQATRRIRDGQRIRVHGTAGYVELLS